jgi:Uma2 family endonuclease
MSASLAERPIPLSVAGPLPFAFGDEMDQPTFHAQYKKLPDHIHAELIGGVVYYKMPIKPKHAKSQTQALVWLSYYSMNTPGLVAVGLVTIKLGLESEPEPDACLFHTANTGGRVKKAKDGFYYGTPDLIVEIAHTTATTDLGRKKRDYERNGVREYLVVIPSLKQVAYFYRRKNQFINLLPGEDGVFRSQTFPGLWLDPAGLFTSSARRITRTLRKGLASPEHAVFVAGQEKKLAAAKSKRKKR